MTYLEITPAKNSFFSISTGIGRQAMSLRKYAFTICISIFLASFFCLIPAVVSADIEITDVTAAASLSYRPPDFEALMGRFEHSIPIDVPPGRNAIGPDLILKYSSTMENGPLGVGWKLSLGAIRRSTKWGTADYNRNDYIAEIEGAAIELVNAEGNAYRAKIEGAFSKYYNNGTAGWEVIARDGTRYFFGTTAGARMEDGNRIFKWALDRVEDTNGNAMTISYLNISGQLYPDEISYDGNNQVQFFWQSQDRVDVITDLRSGWRVDTTKLLERIETYGNGQRAKIFRLTYEQNPISKHSRLQSFQEFSADGQESLPAQVFTWYDGSDGRFVPLDVDSNIFEALYMSPVRYLEDINGDGLTDIIYIEYTHTSTEDEVPLTFKLHINIGNGNGTFEAQYTVPLEGFVNEKIATAKLAHLNRDGYLDLFVGTSSDNSEDRVINYFALFNNQDGTFRRGAGALDIPPAEIHAISNTNGSISTRRLNYSFKHDFNNDGLDDLQLIAELDYDSDLPLPDSTKIKICLANGDGTFRAPVETDFDRANWGTFCDINGDGLIDIIRRGEYTGALEVFYSRGDGSFEDEVARPFDSDRMEGLTVDLNGDGFIDSVDFFPIANNLLVNSNLLGADGNFREDEYTLPSPGAVTIAYPEARDVFVSVRYVELNGDGIRDIIVFTRINVENGDDELNRYVYQGAGGTPPNLLKSISNGYGAVTTVTYDYVKKNEKSFVPYSMHYVRSIETTPGFGPKSTRRFENYTGGLYHGATREFRGFAAIIEQELYATGDLYRETLSRYHQGAFRKGRAYVEVLRDADQTPLVRTTYNWQAIDAGATWGFPRLNLERTEFDNTPSTFSQTTYTYDPDNGLVTSKIVGGTSAENITVTSHYEDFSTSTDGQVWRKTEEIVSGGQTGTARHTACDYQQGTGNLLQAEQICEDGSNSDCDGRRFIDKYAYDNYGNRAYEWDANTPRSASPTVSYAYDATATYPQVITNALGHTVTQHWDARFGKLLWREDENGRRTTFINDDLGRLTDVQYPDGGMNRYTYNDNASPPSIRSRVRTIGDSFHTKWEYFDGLGRLLQTVTHGDRNDSGNMRYIVTKTHFDAMGRAFRQTGPFFRADSNYLSWAYNSYPSNLEYPFIHTIYDHRDRPTREVGPDDQNDSQTTVYDHTGFSVTITDPDGSRITHDKNHLGQIFAVIEHSQTHGDQITRYSYNAAGDLTLVRNPLFNDQGADAKSRTITGYNTLGRKVSLQDPDLGLWAYRYDANGNLRYQTDNAGNTIEFQYDTLNRLRRKIHPAAAGGEQFTYEYDNTAADANGIGRPYRELTGPADAPGVNRTFERYDSMGRVLRKSVRIEGDSTARVLEYAYNFAGYLTRISYPQDAGAFQVNYAYVGGSDLLQQVTDNNNTPIAAFSLYHPSGRIGRIAFGNGAVSQNVYSALTQRLLTIRAVSGQNSLMHREYTYSAAGDVRQVIDHRNNITHTYEYDQLHRLTASNSTGGAPVTPMVLEYAYENSGSAFPLHAPESIAINSQSYNLTYDPNGNLTAGYDFSSPDAPAARSLSYDAANMPTGITRGGRLTGFLYDGDGKRVRKSRGGSVTYYIDDTLKMNVLGNISALFTKSAP